jgi:signal transduction histidine kinase
VRNAQSEADRLDATIDDVIDLARDLAPAPQQASVRDLLTAAEARWRAPLAARTRPLRIETGPDLPTHVALSSAAAAQILDVLIDNAALHGRGAITVHAHPVDGAIAIDVSDEGPPMRQRHTSCSGGAPARTASA